MNASSHAFRYLFPHYMHYIIIYSGIETTIRRGILPFFSPSPSLNRSFARCIILIRAVFSSESLPPSLPANAPITVASPYLFRYLSPPPYSFLFRGRLPFRPELIISNAATFHLFSLSFFFFSAMIKSWLRGAGGDNLPVTRNKRFLRGQRA